MFGLLSKLLSSVATFLFPVFASYKALKANDPSQLTPWLMYWVVIGCITVVESWTGWILCWLPFYQEIRAGFMMWLVLPQFQGATRLYVEHVHPTLEAHEKEIEDLITRTHDQAKAAGIDYIRKLIHMAREQLFGPLPEGSEAKMQPLSQDAASFVTNLFSKWNVAPIASGAPQRATEFYQFLSSALQQQTPEGGPVGTPHPANTATLIPASIEGKEEKARFIEMQKEKLKTLMAALEQEAETNRVSGDASHTSVAAVLDNASDANKANVSRSPSSGNMAGDFDHVTMSDAEKEGLTFIGTPRTGGWFSWGGKPVAGPAGGERKEHNE
ncbi:TB2/DP1, HVA22 family-domain-containing protein [Morchella snyderi]|nr:TB2/DP1, HVA22 family-domain-containing protein [Morchella snyderi]